METNMTALISCFARDCHFRAAPLPILADGLAGKLLSEEESRKTRQLAAAAGSPIRAAYSYGEMEALLAAHGFLLYEHLDEGEATERFFGKHNAARPQVPLSAPAGVCHCLAVRES